MVWTMIWLLKLMGEAAGKRPWPARGGALAAPTKYVGGSRRGIGPCGPKGVLAWLHKLFSDFETRFLDSKFKDLNTFKPNLKWGQTRIDLNKLFEYFSNLEIFKISLNIQIQTKALNERLSK
jgi:hypothetical protein